MVAGDGGGLPSVVILLEDATTFCCQNAATPPPPLPPLGCLWKGWAGDVDADIVACGSERALVAAPAPAGECDGGEGASLESLLPLPVLFVRERSIDASRLATLDIDILPGEADRGW